MNRSIACFSLSGMVALAMLLPIRSASAQDNWTDGTGNWNTPGNWSAGVPGSGVDVNIVDSGNVSRTVTYDYTGPPVALDGLIIDLTGGSGSATNTLSMSANNLTSNSTETIGNTGSGTFNQSGGTNTITSSGVGAIALELGFDPGSSGNYTLSGTGSIVTDNFEIIGFEGTGYFNQIGGTNSCGEDLQLGVDSGSTGTYALNAGSLTVSALEIIGFGGTGNFNQIGGTHTISGSLNIGLDNFAGTGTGTYTLSGGILSAASVYVGGSSFLGLGGYGILTVSETGSLTTPGALKVFNATGTALNLSGGTIRAGSLDLSGNNSRFNWTGGTLDITGSSVTIDDSASDWNGYSSLTLNSGMALEVSLPETVGKTGTGAVTLAGGRNSVGTFGLVVGYENGSLGTYTISGDGSLDSFGSEVIGSSGTGILNQTGGQNNVSGNLSLGVNSGSSGTYTLSGGTLRGSDIYVGGSSAGPGGTGVLTVSGSGSLNYSNQTITVYNTPGSGFNVNGGTVNAAALNLLGTYTHTAGSATYGHITGGGQMNISGGQVILTDDTSGHLASVNVSSPATLGFDVGTSSSSQITADTATFNSTPTIAFTLSGIPDGGAVFTLLSATQFNDNGFLGGLSSQAVTIGRDTLTPSLTGGSGAAGAIIVTVTGGPANLTWIGSNNIGFDTGGAWDTQNTQNWENHSNELLTPDVFYAGDHVTFDDTASNFVVDINNGDVIANSVIFNNSLNAYTVNGTSGIGGSTDVTFAGSNTVTLNNYNYYYGTTTISGGGTVSIAGSIASPTINVTHGTLQLAANSALTGYPVVTLGNGITTGTLDLGGFMNTVGGLSGGAGNLVTNTSSGLATLNFAGGSSTFGGVIQDGNSGGQIALNITSGSLTLCGTNTYSGGTTISGGTLAVNGSILGDVNVNYGGTLAGHGSVAGMVTVNYGAFLSPGSDASHTGTLTLGGLTLNSDSQTNIKLAGTTPGSQYDQVQVSGSASLAGTLSVSLINGFTPQANETFDILTGSTPSGMFNTLQLPSLTGALSWDTSQLYTSGALAIVETFLPGDFNRDGHVDAADVQAMMAALANLSGYNAAHSNLTATQLLDIEDVNNDGVVNNADLQAMLDLLKSGGGSSNSVPEPASLALLGLGALAIAYRRRSR